MEQNLVDVSVNGKIEYIKRYVLLGRVAEMYMEDRKMLKQLKKQIKRERDLLDGSCYPITDSDRQEVRIYLTELSDILVRLTKKTDPEHCKITVSSLREYISKLEGEINKSQPTITQRVINAAKDTAKNLGEKIGRSVEEIKKTAQDAGLK